MNQLQKPKLLLHSCCAGCSAYVIQLLSKQFDVCCYFFNPNVHPEEEYRKRCDELKNYCLKIKIPFIEEKYATEKWHALTKGFEFEPEKGKRCLLCYAMRLEKTAEYAKKNGFEFFGSTLSVSPHKLADRINQFGKKIAELYQVKFYEADFKKHDGFKRACAISRAENFYRQSYCGCVYSKKAHKQDL